MRNLHSERRVAEGEIATAYLRHNMEMPEISYVRNHSVLSVT
jgi:hypothetical protein